MIGLLDYDILTSNSSQRIIPNLEIMKLATYYQQEENEFCRLLTLQEEELSNYKIIYFFSETASEINIPPAFLRANNVYYGGTKFTNNIYVPFDNPLIDFTIARPFIYKNYLKQLYQNGVKANIINHILDDSYYRLYAKNEQLPIPPIQKNKRIFIYDINILDNDWEYIIDNISARGPSTIIPIHPIICHTISDYFKLRNKSKILRSTPIILDLNIPLTDINYLFKKYELLFLADINLASNVTFNLGGDFISQKQYIKDFIYKLNLLYSFWAKKIPIRLNYITSTKNNDPLNNLSLAVTKWTRSTKWDIITLDQFLEHYGTKEKRKIIALERYEYLKKELDTDSLFQQTFQQLSTGGYWKI